MSIRVYLGFMKDSKKAYDVSERVQILYFFSESKVKPVQIAKKIIRLRRFLKQHQEASVVAMLPFETLYTHIACIGLPNRTVFSLRNDPKNMKGISGGIIRNIIYVKADRIVFQTETAKAFFSKRIQEHSCVIPNPVSKGLPAPYTGERKKEIVSVGRLEPQKNHTLLLEAFADIHRKHPDWKLVIYGQGSLLNNLKELCRKLGIFNDVQFRGFISDIPEHIAQSGMFVLASDYEGISNAMLEAMAMGIPCICTDCPAGGARMMIKDHKNGILVPVGEKSCLARAMLELIENPSLADTLSEEAVKIRDTLSVGKIAEKWRELL